MCVFILILAGAALSADCFRAKAQDVFPLTKREQQSIEHRHPRSLSPIPIHESSPPPTVADKQPDREVKLLTLDEAISIALRNSEVVRVLAGATAAASGRTVYDTAILNNTIDQERAAFDPEFTLNQSYEQNRQAFARLIGSDLIVGNQKQSGYNFSASASQRNMTGGTGRISFNATPRQIFGAVSPLGGIAVAEQRDRNAPYRTEVSYTQPLLAGAGVAANRVPIVLARINTERSYFQFNDSVQELVRGVIDAYWSLVFARTDLWARKIQTEQASESLKRSEARKKVEFANITETAQFRASLSRFKANLIAAEANVLQREAALQNILGLPPNTQYQLVPITTPATRPFEFEWNSLVRLATERRPDLIELKLILEADRQQLLQANNRAKPQLDAVALYRWDGLQGRFAGGPEFGTSANDVMGWSLGVNFSVPMYLRSGRAQIRSTQLQIARDKANIDQGVHQVRHQLAQNARNLASFYAQWEAFKEAREATRINLERQYAAFQIGFEDSPASFFLNFINALTDWGNSVSQEAQALAQYNTELANLERQTGTILETHGVFFSEDRFCSIGPKWQRREARQYPRNLRPNENAPRYSDRDTQKEAENFFNLDDYPRRHGKRKPKESRDRADQKPYDSPEDVIPQEKENPEAANKEQEAKEDRRSGPAIIGLTPKSDQAGNGLAVFDLTPLRD